MSIIRYARILLILSLFLVSGCATLTHGSHQEIKLESRPQGATYSITPGNYEGITPNVVNLRRDESYEVEFSCTGYENIVLSIKNKPTGATFSNCLFNGIIGIVVDCNTGAVFKLRPEKLIANFTGKEIPVEKKKGRTLRHRKEEN